MFGKLRQVPPHGTSSTGATREVGLCQIGE